MTENGNPEVIKVTLIDGSLKVSFGKYNTALIGHALRLANLKLDNVIIAQQAPKPSALDIKQTIPADILKRMRQK